MKPARLRIVFLGLTITSSWGNGHATTYRALVRELARRKHDVLFLERDAAWYASNRDLAEPPFGRTALYRSVAELKDRFARDVARADLVVVGSYVPDGIAIGEWVCGLARGVTAFYDIDTPVTLAALQNGSCGYLTRALIRQYDMYLSFTGGPTLERLERDLGANMARPLYCSFDPSAYHPERRPPQWDVGYMGTHCPSRDPGLRRLLIDAAWQSPYARFIVAGPGHDASGWPPNVEYVTHVAARDHRAFYTSQRFTLNLTRADMVRAGYSPSVRLFEAAACGTPIISDSWPGLDTLFVPGREILISRNASETLQLLAMNERERAAIGRRARRRVLAEHTAEHRAIQIEEYLEEGARRGRLRTPLVLPASAGLSSPPS